MTLLPKMMNEYVFENPNVQKFVKSTDLHFDVIVAEEFLSDSFLMFAHKFKAPIVTICKYSNSLTVKNIFCHNLFITIKVRLELLNISIVNKDYCLHRALFPTTCVINPD